MVLGPSERFRNIIGFLSIISTMIGVNVMNPNYRINMVTRFVMFAICVFYINLIYTIYVGIVIEDDWTIVLQVTALLPSALEGMTKLISVLKHQEGWRYLGMAFECVYVAYEQKNQCYRECLMKHVILTRKLLICCILIYFIPALTVVTFPFVYGAIYNERVMAMMFLIPGIDHKTPSGHTMHLGIHMVLFFFGVFGNFAIDTYLFVFVSQIPMLKKILILRFQDLNSVLQDTHDSSITFPMLMDIFKWHQQYISIIMKTEKIFFNIVFVQIFAKAYGLLACLVCRFLGVWPVGTFFLMYSFVMLNAYCALGTVVETSKNEVRDSIYNECLWYEMSVIEQKMVLIMLMKSQNTINLSVGRVMDLSMATALSVTKAIYSYAMVIYNFLQKDSIS